MKHFLLKFNHGLEIGALLAYLGHYLRTKDDNVWRIAVDELVHMKKIEDVLREFDEKPSKVIDSVFRVIGKTIQVLCKVCPLWSLNFIARSMELFAVFNYEKLALVYLGHYDRFMDIALSEESHGRYFKGKRA